MTKMQETLSAADQALKIVNDAIAELTTYRDTATMEISKYLRVDKGIELDVEAIRATLTRPYTIIPINEHEAWLIHWRGIKMPIFGWVISQEPAFLKAKVTRSMDLLTPLPGWMKDELGWKPPEHKAVIDGTRTGVALTEGDESSFKRKYGQHLGAKQKDGTFKIRGGDAWIRLVAALVSDGILPYTPTPVDQAHWNPDAKYSKLLKDLIDKKQKEAGDQYIERAANEFKSKGAVLVNYPPGSGKTLATGAILTHFLGRVLILGDSTMLVDQWRERVKTLVPDIQAHVVFSTYQGAGKYLAEEWDLIIWDEAQRLPANTFSKLAFAKVLYRLGLTGTPWREDARQHLIVALSGFPVAIRWGSLIASGVLRRPSIVVATVPNEAAKTAYVKSLVSKRLGRAMIFCDWISQGQALADALDVPFVHGGTARKLQMVQESDVCVVSRIGDRGISLPDLRLVIEVAGAGSAREQFAQRVGRLLHGEFEGQFVTVFTPEEAARYRGRIFGAEAELAGEVDIEFVTVGNAVELETSKRPLSDISRKATRKAKVISFPGDIQRVMEKAPKNLTLKYFDEISEALDMPAVKAKLVLARKFARRDSVGYVDKVIRYCWDAPLSPKDIAEGLGYGGESSLERVSSACKAAQAAGLLKLDSDGRYRVDKDEINRLKVLSGLRSKA